MKKIVFIISLFFSTVVVAQQPVGLGILKIDVEQPISIALYARPEAGGTSANIEITTTKSKDLVLKNSEATLEWFDPEGFWLDYFIFNFRVVTQTPDWYEVIVNQNTGRTLWIRNSPQARFSGWNEFLENDVTSISAGNIKVRIKSAPSDNSETIRDLEATDCMEILKVLGDWIQVKSHTTLECDESEKPINSGWIKWKQKDALTIAYGITC